MPPPRVIIVTGANRGIGYAICQAILARADLAPLRLFAASRSGDDLALLPANRTPSDGREVRYRALDIADRASVHRFADAVARDAADGVDVLINNAGVNLDAQYGPASVRRTLDVNFRGTREMCQAFLPRMNTAHAAKPRIVNLSSVACALKPYGAELQRRLRSPQLELAELEEVAQSYERAVANGTEEADGFGVPVRSYAVSKALVTAGTRVLARAHGGVSVNSCCPGWIATDMGALVGRRGQAPKTPREGAAVPLHLAFDADVEGLSGAYWANESVRSKGVGQVMEW